MGFFIFYIFSLWILDKLMPNYGNCEIVGGFILLKYCSFCYSSLVQEMRSWFL